MDSGEPDRIGPIMTRKSADTSQSNIFRDTARELGCDEGEAQFDEALRRIAKSPH